MKNKVRLNGNDLTIEDILNVLQNTHTEVEIDPQAFKLLDKSRDFLDAHNKTEVIYGINTGFGPMAGHIISKHQLLELQRNLIVSHAVGIGEPISSEYVLAAMIVRLNTILKGYSGVSGELVKHLQFFINKRIIPLVPEHGAVGTSGDLVQLAHIALALIGEGEVEYEGRIQKTSAVLEKLKVKPYILKSKEGLALINGTSMMAAIGAVITHKSEILMDLAIHAGAWSLEMVNGFSDSLSEVLHGLRPHHGQGIVAQKMREILSTSELLMNRKVFNEKIVKVSETAYEAPREVQDVYSLRCTPQILGPIFDAIALSRKVVSIEINSVTDNPIVDTDNKTFIHGGNFHGDYIAYTVDQLKMTIVKLTMLSERRVNYFLNQKINKRFPPFINLKTPGLSLALQGLQFVATSTTAQSQTLAFPQYVHSISTNADNQDVVSMGTDAALLAAKVVENAFVVMAIELFTLAQAVDYLKNDKQLAKSNRQMYRTIRDAVPAIVEDRVVTDDLKKLLSLVKTGIKKPQN